jgi:hypothetical protein
MSCCTTLKPFVAPVCGGLKGGIKNIYVACANEISAIQLKTYVLPYDDGIQVSPGSQGIINSALSGMTGLNDLSDWTKLPIKRRSSNIAVSSEGELEASKIITTTVTAVLKNSTSPDDIDAINAIIQSGLVAAVEYAAGGVKFYGLEEPVNATIAEDSGTTDTDASTLTFTFTDTSSHMAPVFGVFPAPAVTTTP